jgi:hypothetical protein
VTENGSRYGRGFTLWFTGLSGADMKAISEIVKGKLRGRPGKVEILDGDIVRTNLFRGLVFSQEDRDANALRIGFVADLLTRKGVSVIVLASSLGKEACHQVRRSIGEDFIEILVGTRRWRCAPSGTAGASTRRLLPVRSSSSPASWAPTSGRRRSSCTSRPTKRTLRRAPAPPRGWSSSAISCRRSVCARCARWQMRSAHTATINVNMLSSTGVTPWRL